MYQEIFPARPNSKKFETMAEHNEETAPLSAGALSFVSPSNRSLHTSLQRPSLAGLKTNRPLLPFHHGTKAAMFQGCVACVSLHLHSVLCTSSSWLSVVGSWRFVHHEQEPIYEMSTIFSTKILCTYNMLCTNLLNEFRVL